ncbi:MAG TPA: PhzF family phenazine biosynthesis protein [Thermoanaerobaculia bacterium]
MALEIYQVDAFAERPFTGNPAAVVPLAAPRDAGWMQAVAAEMNLAETAFLVPRGGAAGAADGWDLRWFTPETEIELCGHGTLASAHVLWESGRLPAGETARFHTLSGLLTAERQGELIELDFPALPPTAEPRPPAELPAVLGGAAALWVGRRGEDLVVELADEAAVRALAPDLTGLVRVARGLIATARAAGPPFDFVSRYFAPGFGIAEDPVTGYAHCVLGPFWAERLGRDELLAYQASRRGGAMHVRLAGDRVRLGGRAVTVLRGELTAAAAADPRRKL